MKDEELPEEMKKMDKAERKEYIAKTLSKRKKIQEKITKLSEERRKYVETEMKKNAESNSLDSAIINAIRKQAKDKKFVF